MFVYSIFSTLDIPVSQIMYIIYIVTLCKILKNVHSWTCNMTVQKWSCYKNTILYWVKKLRFDFMNLCRYIL